MNLTIEKRYLGIDEFSKYMGVTKGTLYVWVCRRKIPYLKVGKLVKFDIRRIDSWLKERQVNEIKGLN